MIKKIGEKNSSLYFLRKVFQLNRDVKRKLKIEVKSIGEKEKVQFRAF